MEGKNKAAAITLWRVSQSDVVTDQLGMLEPVCASSQELILHISSQLHIQRLHIGSLKSDMVQYLHHRNWQTLKSGVAPHPQDVVKYFRPNTVTDIKVSVGSLIINSSLGAHYQILLRWWWFLSYSKISRKYKKNINSLIIFQS